MIPRGSGDHHASVRPAYIGKMPNRYAASKVPGLRSAPTATISSEPSTASGAGKSQMHRGGSTGTLRPCARPRYASNARAIWPTWISSVPA